MVFMNTRRMYIADGDAQMAKVIIFGVADFASLGHFYLKHDTKHEVVAFSVSAEFMPPDKSFEGLPVVAFEEVERKYPASDYAFFAPCHPAR